ncbi:hypothetical protein SAMN05443287_1162 [Micromonospora phaseoli]|uniref:DUF2293 domain-containing protein n=1 Tax=Micromonospora phaseoli TaxID=1144548 RepID=A0A1H7DPP0_9ACTN|nr:DUF2293 domain-containing protein [Micromonospora phaseoli]PZV90045.1 hypothetical protein CLV64_114132 [Micromonospora phaseoli]GIJ78738.1 hypothetical protein Xph01_31700 [Micromonospora phaseoli]SEK03719.1 hypothetical protein SAMN05443287_1162 [Micromonospora phaseoli]
MPTTPTPLDGQPIGSKLERRVLAAAQAALSRHRYVSPLDLLGALGWLPGNVVDRWRQGRIPVLEREAAVPASRLLEALEMLGRWARAEGLHPGEVDYIGATRDRRRLRFTAGGDPEVERAYRTHWASAALSESARQRLVQRRSAPPDLVVHSAVTQWSCVDCRGTGELLVSEDGQTLCLTCADLDHLVFLPAGDAAMTRRAKKASVLSAVVVRFNRSRKRYDRLGLLVEPAGLESAERQCLGDEAARLRRRERDRERRAEQDVALMARMAEQIRRLFPGCPASRAEAIAGHTGLRGSGRVGRSAAGRAVDDDAMTRAVIASVRHEDTEYDRLLMAGVSRIEARERIRSDIDRVLAAWRSGS